MEILGNLREMLPTGMSVEFWNGKPSMVFVGNERTITLSGDTVSNWYDNWQAGINLCQPKLGTVVKANKGIIYVCSRTAVPNKQYNPYSIHAGDQIRNEFSAEWTQLPEKIIFLIWPMRDYTRMPVRN